MSQSLLSPCVVFVLKVAMVDVCCMCGDVGFHDKLFRCNKCRYRFQHSYCSNLYGELTDIQVCDWCQSEAKNTRPHNKPVVALSSNLRSCQYSSAATTSSSSSSSSSGHKLTKGNGGNSEKAGKSSPVPSPRHATRRYKLLKDVMC